jgi:hypothetical protein
MSEEFGIEESAWSDPLVDGIQKLDAIHFDGCGGRIPAFEVEPAEDDGELGCEMCGFRCGQSVSKGLEHGAEGFVGVMWLEGPDLGDPVYPDLGFAEAVFEGLHAVIVVGGSHRDRVVWYE